MPKASLRHSARKSVLPALSLVRAALPAAPIRGAGAAPASAGRESGAGAAGSSGRAGSGDGSGDRSGDGAEGGVGSRDGLGADFCRRASTAKAAMAASRRSAINGRSDIARLVWIFSALSPGAAGSQPLTPSPCGRIDADVNYPTVCRIRRIRRIRRICRGFSRSVVPPRPPDRCQCCRTGRLRRRGRAAAARRCAGAGAARRWRRR